MRERNEETGCLSAGSVMALLDGELSSEEKAAALAHLESCARCRALADQLGGSAAAVTHYWHCPDDERLAAYVDHRAGRVRGGLDRAEMARIDAHLAGCLRCREQVSTLRRACRTRASVAERLRSLVAAAAGAGVRLRGPVLRWGPVAVVAVLAYVLLPVLSKPRESEPPAPTAAVEPVPPAPSAAKRPIVVKPGPSVPRTRGAGGAQAHPTAPGGTRQVAPVVSRPSQTALLPLDQAGDPELRRAAAELRQALKRRDRAAEAAAAMELGSLHHQKRRYPEAATYYRQAARAAELAGESQQRVDALVGLGAALAEMGKTEQAREEFEGALSLAQRAGYDVGERNARLQLRLLKELGASKED
jgi:tetratricopeptide (TPR) repeat protein